DFLDLGDLRLIRVHHFRDRPDEEREHEQTDDPRPDRRALALDVDVGHRSVPPSPRLHAPGLPRPGPQPKVAICVPRMERKTAAARRTGARTPADGGPWGKETPATRRAWRSARRAGPARRRTPRPARPGPA